MTADATSDRVVVVVTPGCHLCEVAEVVVAEVCGELAIGWRRAELGEYDDKQQREWREYVPVVLVDGSVHDIFRVDRDRLRAALC